MKGWRTVAFNILMAVIMGWNLLMPEKMIEIDQATLDTLLTTLWGVGNVVLRALTNTQIGKSE